MDSQQARLNNDKDTEASCSKLSRVGCIGLSGSGRRSKIFMAESCKSRKAEKAKDESESKGWFWVGYVCYMKLQQCYTVPKVARSITFSYIFQRNSLLASFKDAIGYGRA